MPRSDYYDADGTCVKQRCPRCPDAFMADHADRRHCGRCGYTEWRDGGDDDDE